MLLAYIESSSLQDFLRPLKNDVVCPRVRDKQLSVIYIIAYCYSHYPRIITTYNAMMYLCGLVQEIWMLVVFQKDSQLSSK